MKLSLTLTIACVASSQAFMTSPLKRSSGTTLFASQDSDAVNQALEASRNFGPSSKEARVAWDIVEEIRASDNRWVRLESVYMKYLASLYIQKMCQIENANSISNTN